MSKGKLDTALEALVAAVRERRAAGLWPTIAEPRARGLLGGRDLAGPRDAARLARWLRTARLAPLKGMASELWRTCEELGARYAHLLRAPLVRGDNGALVGPVWREAVAACALAKRAALPRLLDLLAQRFARALRTFFGRLENDLHALARHEHAKVAELVALADETHAGGQFVMEVALDDGARWAYKPRSCEAEEWVAAASADTPRSLFSLINALPPAAGAPWLPTLRLVRGKGRDRRDYAWQEWVLAPRTIAPVRRSAVAPRGRAELRACHLWGRAAETFWYRAGCLAAASVALGVTDLFADNLRVGCVGELRDPVAVPVDLEMLGYPRDSLCATGLVGDAEDRGNHHVGFERLARRCTTGGPLVCFFERSRSAPLELRRLRAPWSRSTAPALVVDRFGRAGYAAYLPWMLRGLFDCWITLVQRRQALVAFTRARPRPLVRAMARPTEVYARAIDDLLCGGRARRPRPRWTAEERAHLARLDVPAFERRPRGPWRSRTDQGLVTVEPQPDTAALAAPIALPERLAQLDLRPLACAVREAVAFVQRDVDPLALASAARRAALRVELGPRRDRGQVRVRWRQGGCVVQIAWRGRRLGVQIDADRADRPERATDFANRLLQLDRVDGALRERWQRDGFVDRALGRKLDALVAAGAQWLAEALREVGFPGEALVGGPAAAAACRLVQHATRFPALQRRYLRLARAAVAAGDLAPRHLAYLTDIVRLNQGRSQLYGTKFRRVRGRLEPFPIARAAEVDRRRAELGLPSLQRYARRIRAQFATAVAS